MSVTVSATDLSRSSRAAGPGSVRSGVSGPAGAPVVRPAGRGRRESVSPGRLRRGGGARTGPALSGACGETGQPVQPPVGREAGTECGAVVLVPATLIAALGRAYSWSLAVVMSVRAGGNGLSGLPVLSAAGRAVGGGGGSAGPWGGRVGAVRGRTVRRICVRHQAGTHHLAVPRGQPGQPGQPGVQ